MTTVYDVPADRLIASLAQKLRGMDALKAPEWAAYVKTGVHREKPPVDSEWWHVRAAAVLRKVYTDGPVGTERLRAHFGGPRNRGSRPERAQKGSGSIVREILQQLESEGLIARTKDKGRTIAPKGQSLVDNTAHEVRQALTEDIPTLARY